MRLGRSALVVGAIVVVAAACVPPPAPPAPAPYLDQVFTNVVVTPKGTGIPFGAAPPVDPTVGSANDTHARQVDAAGNEIIHLWMADPTDNPDQKRPAIIWVHGGGFVGGIGAEYGLANGTGAAYAKRGYVGFSIEYRIDTTSQCQYVQDHQHEVPLPPNFDALRAQCVRGITAAVQDSQAAVRWVRRHAAAYRIDPNKVAIGGFSAGAVTADMVAFNSDLAGSWKYSADDDPAASSRVQAAFGASGCNYDPSTIGVGDSPTSFIHSEFDRAVDYRDCVVPTFTAARGAGLVAELTSYCGQTGHAAALYQQHLATTDAQWTTFLARELRIYSKLRPASADPLCP
ncbi:MAG: alpha/beta hydrolase fold domain-containing protein [Acidimicrobiia bacterium]